MPSLKYYDQAAASYKYLVGGMSQATADATYVKKAGDVVTGPVNVFANSTARNTALPVPADGMVCTTAGYQQVYGGGIWKTVNGVATRTPTGYKSVSTRYWSKFLMDGSLTTYGQASEMYAASADTYGIKVLAGGLYLATASVIVDTIAASQIVGMAVATVQPGGSNGMYPFPTVMANLATLPSRPTYLSLAANAEVWGWVYLNVNPTNVQMTVQLQYLGG